MEMLHNKFKIRQRTETCRILRSDVDDIRNVHECSFDVPVDQRTNNILVTSVCVYDDDPTKVVFRNDYYNKDLKKVDMKGPVLKILVSSDFLIDGQVVVMYQEKDETDFKTAIIKYGGISKIVRKSIVKRHTWNACTYSDDSSSLGSRILQSDIFNCRQEEPNEINRACLTLKRFRAFVTSTGSFYSVSGYEPDRISTNMKEVRFVKQLARTMFSTSFALVFGSYKLISRNSRNSSTNGSRIAVLSPNSWSESYMFLATKGGIERIESNNGFAGLGVIHENNYLIYFHWRPIDGIYNNYDAEKAFVFNAPGVRKFCFSNEKLYTVGNWGSEIRVYNNFQAKYVEASKNITQSAVRNITFSPNVLEKDEHLWRGTNGKLSVNEAESVRNRYRGLIEDLQRFELGEPDTIIDFNEHVLKIKMFSEGSAEVLAVVTLDNNCRYNCVLLGTRTNTVLFNQKFNKNITNIDYKIYKTRPVEGVLTIEFCHGEETLRFEIPKRGVETIEIKNAHIERIARSSSANDRVGRHIDIQ